MMRLIIHTYKIKHECFKTLIKSQQGSRNRNLTKLSQQNLQAVFQKKTTSNSPSYCVPTSLAFLYCNECFHDQPAHFYEVGRVCKIFLHNQVLNAKHFTSIAILSSSQPKYSKFTFYQYFFLAIRKDYSCEYSTGQNFSEDANIMSCFSNILSHNSEVIKD